MNKIKVLSEVEKKGYFLPHSSVLIAVSTGLDSMNLLYFLNEMKEKLNISIAIAHVNHHQRPESDIEEEFLRNWALSHDIPFFISHFQGKFTEANAREYRYKFFENIMRQEGYTALVTAHHADDQAETVFMRLIKGKHLKSLISIKEKSKFANGEIIRPFLSLKKEDFDTRIPHFDDKSNFDSSFFRNRIRNEYLPLLVNENPKFKDSLIGYSHNIANIYNILEELTTPIHLSNVNEFLTYSFALQSFLIEQHLEKNYSVLLSQNEIQQIVHLIIGKANVVHHIKDGIFLEKHYDYFKFSEIGPKTDEENIELVVEYGETICYNRYLFHFSEGAKGRALPVLTLSPLIIRKRKKGDKIRINNITKKLRRLFIDEKIPTNLREEAIIIEQEKTILAVVVDDKCYLRNDSKDDIMKGILYMEELEK